MLAGQEKGPRRNSPGILTLILILILIPILLPQGKQMEHRQNCRLQLRQLIIFSSGCLPGHIAYAPKNLVVGGANPAVYARSPLAAAV